MFETFVLIAPTSAVSYLYEVIILQAGIHATSMLSGLELSSQCYILAPRVKTRTSSAKTQPEPPVVVHTGHLTVVPRKQNLKTCSQRSALHVSDKKIRSTPLINVVI